MKITNSAIKLSLTQFLGFQTYIEKAKTNSGLRIANPIGKLGRMELFQKAITVKLSHKNKYLVAEDNQESVYLDRDGSLKNAVWAVEIVENGPKYLRFKSYYGKYLTASNVPFPIPGSTGRKVLQTVSEKPDSSTEWEPIRDGFSVRFKTPGGTFLRPNGGLPPWRNSVTHDIPHRRGTQEKILWDIHVVWAIPKTPVPSAKHLRGLSGKKFYTARAPPILGAPKLAR